MKFEEIILTLKEGKEIKRKNRNKINYIRIGEEDFIVDENDECFPFILEDFLADNWEIVEETKKVKLRDLTKEQYVKWRENNCCVNICCYSCPFKSINCDIGWHNYKEMYSDKFLDQEIEIDE